MNDNDSVSRGTRAGRSTFIGRSLLTLATVVFVSSAAWAGPTKIICTNDQRHDFPPMIISLDDARGTANIVWPAHAVPNGRFAPIQAPAKSSGPLRAKFNKDSIEFDRRSGKQYEHYAINRITGVLLSYDSYQAPWSQASERNRILYQYHCQVAKKQF